MLLYYVSMSIPPVFDLIVLLMFQEIDYLAFSLVVGFVIALLFRLKFINFREIIKEKSFFRKKKLYSFYLKQSFAMKSVNLIPQLIKNVFIFFLLAKSGTGVVTLYTYCTYIAYTAFKIVFEPVLQQNLYTITDLFYRNKFEEIKEYLKNVRTKRSVFYIFFSITLILTVYQISISVDVGFKANDIIAILLIQFLFHLFLFFEETYNSILYADRNVKYYLVKNIFFVVVFFILLNLATLFKNSYLVIITSLLLSQLCVSLFSRYLAFKRLANVSM